MQQPEREPHLCDLCGQEREAGSFLVTKPDAEPAWVCDDCKRMLTLGVDDVGTPGD